MKIEVAQLKTTAKRISRLAIQRMVDQIADRFKPEQIILFGSYAYGSPHQDSDVDVLVVMPAKNEIDQAIRIRDQVDHPFPLDLLVRTPENLRKRLKQGDWFLREIVDRGKVVYDSKDVHVSDHRTRVSDS